MELRLQDVDSQFSTLAKESIKKDLCKKLSDGYAVYCQTQLVSESTYKKIIYVLWGTKSVRDEVMTGYLSALKAEKTYNFKKQPQPIRKKINTGANRAELLKFFGAELHYPLEAYLDRLQEEKRIKLPYDRIDSCLSYLVEVAQSDLKWEKPPDAENSAAIPSFKNVEVRQVTKNCIIPLPRPKDVSIRHRPSIGSEAFKKTKIKRENKVMRSSQGNTPFFHCCQK